jgi:hypothetical protein
MRLESNQRTALLASRRLMALLPGMTLYSPLDRIMILQVQLMDNTSQKEEGGGALC